MMRHVLSAAAWLALAAPVAFAQEADGTVVGFVFEDGSGLPLVGATVTVGSLQVQTDAQGAFVVSMAPGTFEVTVTAPDGRTRPTTAVRVVSGQPTELLVTWSGADILPAQVEEPPGSAPVQQDVEGAAGRLEGRVLSAEDGAPVAGARIYVRGRTTEAVSDAQGRFGMALPAGSWELSVVASAFASQTVDGVAVGADEVASVSLELVPAGLALDDFTVRAPKVTGGTAELFDERKTSTAVADVIGAEQMTRAGDSSAASALRRVTGLTLVGGKFIYVRGLGERYSATLLNNGQLPSPEPERRVVPLDLFPSSILESVVIQKTFSPDLPAEFGGGMVLLRTRAFPTAPVVKVQFKTAFRGGTTFDSGLVGGGGSTDFLGVDGGARALSPEVVDAISDSALKEKGRFSTSGFTAEELAALGKTFPNVWTPEETMILPDFGFGLSLGNGWELANNSRFGVLAALSFDNAWASDTYQSTFYNIASGGVVQRDADYVFNQTTNNVQMSGLLSMGGRIGEHHTIQSSTMVLRSTDNESRIFEGFLPEEAFDIRVTRLRWIERMLIVQQLTGEHQLGVASRAPKLTWRYGFAQAFRGEPDRRQTRYDFEEADGVFRLSRRDGDSNARFFSDNDDKTHDGGLDLLVPIRMNDRADIRLKVGGSIMQKDRVVDTRRFSFLNKGLSDDATLVQTPEQIFQADNIRPDGFQIKEVTQATDNYLAAQTLAAGYVMAEIPALPWLDIMAGARVEYSRQATTTFELFNPNGEPIVSELDNTDVLPALTLTFRPRDDMAVRLGYGRTLSRPEFRELSPAIFQDVVGGRDQFGNPELERATIDNADVRWDWFLDRTDVVSVSAFYKYFTRPIETIVIIGADESLTYDNADAANNFGAEIEVRKGLGFLHPKAADVYVAGNAAFISSSIVLPDGGVQTNSERALQGQSPWVVNLQLGYDNPELGIHAALLYNVVGPRIVEVGSFGLPDAYEQPVHQLDAVIGAQLPKGFDVRLTGRNLLDQRARVALESGEVLVERRPGWSLGLRLGWSL